LDGCGGSSRSSSSKKTALWGNMYCMQGERKGEGRAQGERERRGRECKQPNESVSFHLGRLCR